MSTVPLILAADPVSRLDRSFRRTRSPNIAVVYATGDGTIDVLDGGRPMTFGDQIAGRYRHRYEVDLSDHRRTIELRTSPPPARGGIYHFETLVDIGFRVVDPGEVVRRNVQDALRLVSDHLMHVFRGITSNFPIEDALAAEDAVNARFRHGSVIDGCLELYLCRARLEPDKAAVAYLQAEQHANRKNIVNAAEHAVNADDARRTNDIDLIRQSGSLEQRAREHQALAGRPLNAHEMLRIHLENNPTDTAGAVQMAAELEARQWAALESAEQRRWERFQFMAQQDLVQAVDVGEVRDRMLSGLAQPPAPLQSGPATRGWDDPLPIGAGGAPGPVPATVPGLIPVYVVIDEAAAALAGMEAVNAGLQSLYDAVAGQPQIASVIRLAVLTYGDGAAVRLALQAVQNGIRVPSFSGGGGPTRLTAAFERLMDCIPRDAATLKQQTASLRRPQVLLFSAGAPSDDPAWRAPHRALVDRAQQRYAPDVIACGVGPAAPRTMLSIATQPELAFADPDKDLRSAINRFYAFAQRRVIEYGQAVLDGDQTAQIVGPAGFRPATQLLATDSQGD